MQLFILIYEYNLIGHNVRDIAIFSTAAKRQAFIDDHVGHIIVINAGDTRFLDQGGA